jgi:hypothetical protein
VDRKAQRQLGLLMRAKMLGYRSLYWMGHQTQHSGGQCDESPAGALCLFLSGVDATVMRAQTGDGKWDRLR